MRAVHLVPAAVVLVALGAIGGVAQLDHPAAPRQAAAVTQRVAVTSVARACPPAPGSGSAPVTLLGGRAGSTGTPGDSHIDLTALPPAGLTLRPASPVRAQSPGVVSLLTLPAGAVTGKKRPGGPGLVGDGHRPDGPVHGGRTGGQHGHGQRPLRRTRLRPLVRRGPDSRTARRRSRST